MFNSTITMEAEHAMEVEIEAQERSQGQQQREQLRQQMQESRTLRRALLALNFAFMVIGATASPLLLRFYFLHGGHRKWLSSCLQTAGWPINLLFLAIAYRRRRQHDKHTKIYFITPNLFLASIGLGLLTGLDDFLYAYGVSYLPVSTSSILISTQLGFTALFAFLIVRQRFTEYSINAVTLLTFGAVILGLHASGDRPRGETKMQYYEGFAMTLGAAVLYAFVLPMVELCYAKAKQEVTYTLVMEMQMVMALFATVFCTAGMVIDNDFQVIPREARTFGLGESTYYLVLVLSAMLWQLFFLGTIGAIYFTSALVSGIIMTVLIPVTEVLAVIFFHEEFNGGKCVSLALSLWGFASYFYGELKTKKQTPAMVEPSVLEEDES